MGKYGPLAKYLAGHADQRCALSFRTIEAILGESLPDSAHHRRGWWGNTYSRNTTHVQAKDGWHAAGWAVVNVDFSRETVTFERGLGKTPLWS